MSNAVSQRKQGIFEVPLNTDPLILYGKPFSSRLLLGTARYPSLQTLTAAVQAAKPAMLTAALRRASQAGGQTFWQSLQSFGVPILPNTAHCYSIQEVMTTAMMAREVFDTRWIKLELIGDRHTLQPDILALPSAADRLIREGFYVLPYCTEDLVLCRRLLDVGCEALMPWGAPIGTGKGIVNPYAIRLLRDQLPDARLLVDAGLGLPSHAAQVMEWGYDGVLLNTAIACAIDPVMMAQAFALAVRAGRYAYLAGPIQAQDIAQASTPIAGFSVWHQIP